MIKVGVIPAAGRGTRMLPLTRAMPKEMVIVNGKPFIQYVVEGMVEAGITKIYIISGWKKSAVLDYFGSGESFGADIAYVVQNRRLGLANAIARAERFVSEPFVVGLGDDIFYPVSCVREIVSSHEKQGAAATVSVEEVAESELHKYGVVKIDSTGRIVDLVEKPASGSAPSNLAIAGIYAFEPDIFDAIRQTPRGINNEYQLTDAIKTLIASGRHAYAQRLSGRRITIGSIEELKLANEFFVHMNSTGK